MRRFFIMCASATVGTMAAFAVIVALGGFADALLGWPPAEGWTYWLWRGLSDLDARRDLAIFGWWEWLLAAGFIGALAGLAVATITAWWLFRCFRSEEKVPGGGVRVRGRNLSESLSAARRELGGECRRSSQVASVHPSLPLSDDRSRRGLLILGSPGGGKTQVIDHLLRSLSYEDHGQKALVYDNKLDYTQALGGLRGVALFAPWDRRGLVWDVAADVRTRAEARDLAARLVPAPQGENAIFAEGARQILTGLIVHLQRERPAKWSFGDIAELASLPYPELRSRVVAAYPVAASVLPEEANRTVHSMMANLGTYLADVYDLADAWSKEGHGGRRRLFSFRRWLLQPRSAEARRVRMLVVQGHRGFAQLTRGYVQALIGAIGGLLSDMTDSRRRELWLILDELPQLGRIDDLMPFLEVGRSKGVRPVLAAQDLAQLRGIYGRDAVEALGAMIGTYVVCRSQGCETPQWVSELVGDRTVERRTHSVNRGAGNFAGDRFLGTTESELREAESVISPDEVSSTLGPSKKGIRALLVTGGKTTYRLTWPYIDLATALGSRPAAPHKPARWTRPDWTGARSISMDPGTPAGITKPPAVPQGHSVDPSPAKDSWSEHLEAIVRGLPGEPVSEDHQPC